VPRKLGLLGLFQGVEEEVYKWFVDLRSNGIVETSLGLKNKMANIMRRRNCMEIILRLAEKFYETLRSIISKNNHKWERVA
jgi:hypothetical protein